MPCFTCDSPVLYLRQPCALPEGWDIGERQEMVTLKGHSDIVMGMMVMRSLDNLVSASLDTSIRVWDTYTQKPVHTLLGHNKVRMHTGGEKKGCQQASRGANVFYISCSAVAFGRDEKRPR